MNTTSPSALAEIDRLLGLSRMRLSLISEQLYQQGRMSPEQALEWRLSPERWEAVAEGIIEADEHTEPAPVVSFSAQRAVRR